MKLDHDYKDLKRAQSMRRLYAERKQAGRCITCPAAPDGKTLRCKDCNARMKERRCAA